MFFFSFWFKSFCKNVYDESSNNLMVGLFHFNRHHCLIEIYDIFSEWMKWRKSIKIIWWWLLLLLSMIFKMNDHCSISFFFFSIFNFDQFSFGFLFLFYLYTSYNIFNISYYYYYLFLPLLSLFSIVMMK